MKQITTFTNSFVLQEVDGSQRVINELGFRKGGLSYKIMNNNVKFYLTEDYFYKNVIWSADIPLKVDGISYDVNALPTALKKIFILEKDSGGTEIDIDHELNPASDNPVANSTLTPIIREIQSGQSTLADAVRQNTQDILNRYTKNETNALLQSYYTKLETNRMFANYTNVNGDILTLNNENITV